jgi:hypothetical protein
MGVIPAEAVGNAIQARIEQGAIYGNNNPLAKIGQAGQSLSMMPPSKGRGFSQDINRGIVPKPSFAGAAKELFSLPIYPIKKYGAARRLEEPAPFAQSALPTATSVFDMPEKRRK